MDINGRIALVTGAADGIGAGIAERLAAVGMAVVIADPDETTGRATAARIGGSFVAADVATEPGLGTASHGAPEYAVAKAGVIRFTACLAPLRGTMGVRVNCICPGLVDTPSSRRSRARMTPAELAALPPVLASADIAAAAMVFLADDSLAGRIMLCRGGEPPRLLPVTDGQELA
jgi:NAD(P)-dependent dehydrogenase (short-subunit alcohol dehydrogenase family)